MILAQAGLADLQTALQERFRPGILALGTVQTGQPTQIGDDVGMVLT